MPLHVVVAESTQTTYLRSWRSRPWAARLVTSAPKSVGAEAGTVTRATSSSQDDDVARVEVTQRTWRSPPVWAALRATMCSTSAAAARSEGSRAA